MEWFVYKVHTLTEMSVALMEMNWLYSKQTDVSDAREKLIELIAIILQIAGPPNKNLFD